MGEGAFRRYRMLRSVTFQRGARLARIEAFCFAESGLREISFPVSVCAVGDAAFEKCTSLKKVSLASRNRLQVVERDAFHGTEITQ